MIDSYSYSMITAAHRCSTLFKYQHVDKIPQPGPESGDMKFGTGIHLGVEGILTGSDGLEDFNLFWDLEKSKNNAYGRFDWLDLRTMADVFLSRFTRLHAKKYKVSQMEQRLYGEYSGFKFEGTPDFVGEYDGVLSVVDFKTSGYRYHKLRAYVSEQMYLYAYLARMHGFDVNQIVYTVFIKGNTPSIQVIVQKIDESVMASTMRNLATMALELDIRQGTDTFTQNKSSCVSGEIVCPYFTNCYPNASAVPQLTT